jgi:metal-sulfur cluster biosynthetic enzyme
MADDIELSRDAALSALYAVIDPELGFNIVDLGLIYQIEVQAGVIKVTMTMTTPGCPAQDYILSGVLECSQSLAGVRDVLIDLVWEPPWSAQKMSALAKAHFGIQE